MILANSFWPVQIIFHLIWRHRLYHKASRLYRCYCNGLRGFVWGYLYDFLIELKNLSYINALLSENIHLGPHFDFLFCKTSREFQNKTFLQKIICYNSSISFNVLPSQLHRWQDSAISGSGLNSGDIAS